MFSKSTFDPTDALRAALQPVKDNHAEVARTGVKRAERQQRLDDLIDSGAFDDKTKTAEATDLIVQLQMVGPAIKRLEDMEPGLRAALQPVTLAFGFVLAAAQNAAHAALRAHAKKLLAPLFAGGKRPEETSRKIDEALDQFLDCLPAYGDFHADTRVISVQVPGQEVEYAERALQSFDGLVAAFKKHAALLPPGFAPFPKSAEEMLEILPEYLRPGHEAK